MAPPATAERRMAASPPRFPLMRREGRAAEPLLKGGATGPVEVPEVLVEPVEIEEEVEVEVLLVVEVPVELVRVLGLRKSTY